MALSKKDYELIADTVSEVRVLTNQGIVDSADDAMEKFVALLCEKLMEDNPNFDANKFVNRTWSVA